MLLIRVPSMECCSGVVTQVYGQPDNPVPYQGTKKPCHTYRRAISRIATTESARSNKFNDEPEGGGLRRALSRYALTFQGKLTSGKLVLPDSYPCPAHDHT
ncbi:hypothetical protein NGB58_17100 [Escherichia coli]|nr:hypothetical protein [Escherichia coli]